MDALTQWFNSAIVSPLAFFAFLRAFYTALPGPIQHVIWIAFGGTLILGILRGIGR